MPLLSWIRLIDVHQNVVFEMGKNRWRARVTENRCKNNKLVNIRTLRGSLLTLSFPFGSRTLQALPEGAFSFQVSERAKKAIKEKW